MNWFTVDAFEINSPGDADIGLASVDGWEELEFPQQPALLVIRVLLGDRTCVSDVSRETMVGAADQPVEIVGVRTC